MEVTQNNKSVNSSFKWYIRSQLLVEVNNRKDEFVPVSTRYVLGLSEELLENSKKEPRLSHRIQLRQYIDNTKPTETLFLLIIDGKCLQKSLK